MDFGNLPGTIIFSDQPNSESISANEKDPSIFIILDQEMPTVVQGVFSAKDILANTTPGRRCCGKRQQSSTLAANIENDF